MARIKRGRNPEAIRLAALRRRGKEEVQRLEAMYMKLTAEDKAGYRGAEIRQHQDLIREQSQKTYLGRKPDGDRLLEAREAANTMTSMIGKKGERGRAAAQARRDRIFRTQIRVEEESGGDIKSARYAGKAGTYHYERIFYMATQSMWAGKPNEERDREIMKKMGVSSLEEAYDIIIKGNAEAISMMDELELTGEGWDLGYDDITAYIEDAYDIIERRKQS